MVIPEDLPERKPQRTIKEEKVALKSEIDKDRRKHTSPKRNQQRRQWYRWKKRAEAVGIEPLPAKKPTKGQRKECEQSIISAEEG